MTSPDGTPDDAVIAAREWFEDATRRGVITVTTDTTGWTWLPCARPLDSGRHLVRLANPDALIAAAENLSVGRDEHIEDAMVFLEMEHTSDGWRYCGQPPGPTSAPA